MLDFLNTKSRKNRDNKKLSGNSVGENKGVVELTSLKKGKASYTIDDINSYVGRVVSKAQYTEMFKHINEDDTYMIELNTDIDLRKLMDMIQSYLGIEDEQEVIHKVAGMYKEFNWLTRDLIILAYINKSLKLGRPKVKIRHNKGNVIPSVILCSDVDYRFITGYIVHHGLGYEMQEVSYGGTKAYAPYRQPLEDSSDLNGIVHHLNYQYTLLY